MLSFLKRARADVTFMNELLPAAERIARADGVERPEARHLVVAAIRHPDGIARRALEGLGIAEQDLVAEWELQQVEALESIGVQVDLAAVKEAAPAPGQPRIYHAETSQQSMFQRAVAIAKSQRVPMSSGHILLAATEEVVSELALVFDRLGVDRSDLREALSRP